MGRDIAKRLLKREAVNTTDAARLVLEMMENLGERAVGLKRRELVCLLRRVVVEGTEVVKRREQTVSFRELVQACLAFKQSRVRPLTMRDLKSFTNRLMRLPGIAEKPVRSFTVTDCRQMLEQAFSNSAHSYRKGRAILHGLFTFAYKRQWCDADNPVSHIEEPAVKEREIIPLTLEEVDRLMHITERADFADMRLSVYLMTYCGIRPAEVARLSPEDIDLQEGVVNVRPLCSKTGGGRLVPLRRAKLIQDNPMSIPPRWQDRWRQLRRKAGFHNWVPDVLRHTFASYHLRHFSNPPQLQAEMGHRDSALIRTRYTNLRGINARSAEKFWGCQGKVKCHRFRKSAGCKKV